MARKDVDRLEELRLELREVSRARSQDDAVRGIRNTVGAARAALAESARNYAPTWDASRVKPFESLEVLALLHVLSSEAFEAQMIEGVTASASAFSKRSRAELDAAIRELATRIEAAELELEKRSIEDRIAVAQEELDALGARA